MSGLTPQVPLAVNSPQGPQKEVTDNIALCYQMGDEGANLGPATRGDFDVFLSFRGPDTRNTFADCLYESMKRTGIRIFRDEEALDPGKNISEILGAIKCSQIYIPIFSHGYASSQWCLRELTCMVECTRQSTGKEILPIFYKVDPSDVKLETNLYQSSLRKHEVDNHCTLVKSWKEALTTAARAKGWCLTEQSKHGKVITDVTEKVSQKITIRKRCLPTDLVGIDDHIEAIKQLLSCDTGGVRFVIIHGIGGIGKTTLANAVFNQLSTQFEGHSFLSNIRDSSSSSEIAKMQKKLVADVFGFSLPKTFDREEGSNMIRERLPDKRVLLVLDDMDEIDRFMQLAMNSYLYGLGTRIIITTRDFPMSSMEGLEGNILTQSTQILLYEMKEMHFDHALLLFNKLAFNIDLAPNDLCDLSRQVVELTGGLPLALEVIGSHLRTTSKAMWKTTIKKLKEVPHEKVQQRLRISYDTLGCEGQQIFLDIACFFVNKKKTNAMYMWEACYFYPEVEIDILIRKSLIKIEHDRILIHDQLRDLGRNIVRQENIKNLGDRSRLWFLEMSQAKKGTENVAALTSRRSGHNFTRKDFANLMKARFLKLDGGNFAGNFVGMLPELRWLCWQNCPPKLQANNFLLNHLVVLKLSGDITIEEWSRWIEIMVASKLKVLKIVGSKSLIKTPCFSEFMSLERLVLKNFLRLAEIDRSIGELQQLIHLKIKWCPHLRELPKEIGCLTALKELILIQGHNVCYLPNSIGNLRDLSRLVMEDTGLVELPDTVKGLVHLTHLCLVNCTNLNSLSDSLGELESLKKLDLSGTTIGNLPRLILQPGDLTLRMNSFGIRTQLMRDLPMQGHGVYHLPDLNGDLRDSPRLSMEDTGVEHRETNNGRGDLQSLHLLNSTSLNWQSDAVGELRTLSELDLSGTTTGELSPSIWNLEGQTLQIDGWGTRRQLRSDLPIHGDSICYLPDSISNIGGLSSLVREDTGLAIRMCGMKGLMYLRPSKCSVGQVIRRVELADLYTGRGGVLLGFRVALIHEVKGLLHIRNCCADLISKQMSLVNIRKFCADLISKQMSLLDIYGLLVETMRRCNEERDRELDRNLHLWSFSAKLICKRVLWNLWVDLIGKQDRKQNRKQKKRQDLRSLWADLIRKKDSERGLLWRLWADLICKQDCKMDGEQDLTSRWLGGGSNQIKSLSKVLEVSGPLDGASFYLHSRLF